MNYQEATDQLKLVRAEIGQVSSAHALSHYVDKAAKIIRATELEVRHQPGPDSKFTDKEFDIRHDAIQSLGYSLDREGGWARSADSGILKSKAKRNEAQRLLNGAIYHLQTNIDDFLSTLKS